MDENYRLGPGDRLALVLTGDVSQSYTLDVTREGFVVVPQAGQITFEPDSRQLRKVLYSRLGRVYSGVRRGAGATTQFSVSPVRLGSNQIFVLGEVLSPGSYRISSAGQRCPRCTRRRTDGQWKSANVQIRRGGRTMECSTSTTIWSTVMRPMSASDQRRPDLRTGELPVFALSAKWRGRRRTR